MIQSGEMLIILGPLTVSPTDSHTLIPWDLYITCRAKKFPRHD